jgi:hypothetical protein
MRRAPGNGLIGTLVLFSRLSHTAVVVTLRTWAFAIRFNHSSTPVAHALICPEIKYVGLRWQDGRLDRRHVPDSLWPGLEQELAREMAAGPVSRSSMISTVLVGSMGALMNVSFIDLQRVDVTHSQDPAAALDAVAQLGQPA